MNSVGWTIMDGGVDEEAGHLNATEGRHLRSKESEYSRKSENGTPLTSQEVVLPPIDVEYNENSSHQALANILEGKDVNVSLSSYDGLDLPYASPHSMDVNGMVEELTVRNYDNLNMAVVGPSKSSDRTQSRLNQWQQLYHTSGRSAHGGMLACPVNKEQTFDRNNLWEDVACTSVSEMLPQKPSKSEQNEAALQLACSENKGTVGAALARGACRTKILSKSGFSEYFIKSTLKGKGIIRKGPPVDNQHVESRSQNNVKIGTSLKMVSEAPPNPAGNTLIPPVHEISGTRANPSDTDGRSLREWLNSGNREVNKVERVNIFRQILDIVDCSHSNGIALHELRPSCFKLLPSNQVKYLGPLEQRKLLERGKDGNLSNSSVLAVAKRPSEYGLFHPLSIDAKKQKFNEHMNFRQWPQFPSRPRLNAGIANVGDISASDLWSREYGELSKEYDSQRSNNWYNPSALEQHSTDISVQLEEKWYQSPEELASGGSSTSSNIYSLGVLLFELLGYFDSERARNAAMMDLRNRILPPRFLSENPKEAGFCLWLLHPDPASRPSSRKILQSEVLNGLKDVNSEEVTSSIEQDDAESELLFNFLISLTEQKQKEASKLEESINCLEADIAEIGRRHCAAKPSVHPYLLTGSSDKNWTSLNVSPWLSPVASLKESRWLGNVKLLETAYFSMRSRIELPEMDTTRRADNDLLRDRKNCHQPQQRDEELQSTSDRVGAFFDGLCKYARYNKFEVRGILRNGEFNNSANVICSLSFSRDEDFFAAAGVSKKIKVFEFNGLLNESVDIHYPAIEMSNRSKLSCICWNNYIRNYLGSTDYDGVVKLWDASTGQGFSEYSEHEKRAWSIDFSPASPTKFASGSDDCTVKLWSINEKNSLRTIRNIANVCCVQFSAHSTHLLAFGSADYKTYCYDLRNVRSPWCILSGHHKAVSYVKFLDSGTIVTASTDNTLKLWDLNKTSPSGLSTNACSLTLSGHTNEKNFVGLSVADGYITCGSETNEVFSYHRSLPMPISSHKFGSIDPISGKETDDDNGQFVSSVCWKGKSDMLVAANSSGCIKVLQMV